MKVEIDIGNNTESLNRPAWSLQGGFEAYNHKHIQSSTRYPDGLIRNYYKNTGGQK